ncbi:MAG TPA: hydroxymethylbilane synthase [Thermoanaerobaculia bacterium]|nr:hydroxymethylbilane synthase [Thermoanaerobaculia bacterium]
MSKIVLRLGTRRSALAQAQSGQIARRLEAANEGLEVELVLIETRGDQLTGDLAAHGGKGLFTAELEARLLDGSLDLAVHSLKDLPVELATGLVVAAYPERADPRDVLVSEDWATLAELPARTTVMTGALRRRTQILHLRPDLKVEALRGNIDTRVKKWREREDAALILAAAGLARLGLEDVPATPLEEHEMLPAPGQGALAIEVAEGSAAEPLCAVLDHRDTREAVAAERWIVAAFGGDCTLPLAAWARRNGNGGLVVSACLGTLDGTSMASAEATGESPEDAAQACVAALEANGARDILERVRAAQPQAAK